MESPEPQRRVIRTYLSRRPRHGSLWPALLCEGIFFVLTLLSWDTDSRFPELLSATPDRVFAHHEYWRLFTTLAVHSGMEHYLGNLLFFIPFAWLLYSYFGAFVFPFVSIAAGALVNALVLASYPPDQGLIGASGIVYFMVAFWIVMYIGIEKIQSLWQRIARCTVLVLAELAPQAFDPQVSYGCHAAAFALGIATGIAYFSWNKKKFARAEVYYRESSDPLE